MPAGAAWAQDPVADSYPSSVRATGSVTRSPGNYVYDPIDR